MTKNLSIEIYKEGGAKFGYAARSIEDASIFLAEHVNEVYAKNLLDSLKAQLLNSTAFPNVIIFLNQKGKSVALNKRLVYRYRIIRYFGLFISFIKGLFK